jgi:hypothetical protein
MIDLCLNMTFRKHEKVRSSWPPRNKVLAAFAESSRENLEEKILQGIAHRQNRDYLGENWPRHLGLLISSRLFPDRNGFILSEDAEELHQDLAIEWITALYRSRDDERVPCQGEFFPYLLESIVVADWAMELLGFPDEVPESAEELFQSITKAMGKHLDREGRRRIRDYWSALVNCQLEVMAALNRAKPSIPKGELEDFANLRHQLKRERKIVRRLSKEC